MKIAIVYDWVDKWGGVERVLLNFFEIFPRADFYTSYFNKEKAQWARNFKINTTFIQKMPNLIKNNRFLSLIFYPIAFESLDFKNYHLVISITSSFSKGIITQPKTRHIVYLLTPTRFLWVMPEVYGLNGLKKRLISPYIKYLKQWDFVAAQRADEVYSISKTVAKRCSRYYKRNSKVIYPPFDYYYWESKKEELEKNYFTVKKKFTDIGSNYFLIVSRLESYKKIDLPIQVFNQLNQKLVIVGEGTKKNYLRKLAKKDIYFFSNISDMELVYLYLKAQATIIPQEEDFGYVALESQYFNCPVIGHKIGGSSETVSDGVGGVLFEKQTEENLLLAIERFHKLKYNLKNKLFINKNKVLRKFKKEKFINFFKRLI